MPSYSNSSSSALSVAFTECSDTIIVSKTLDRNVSMLFGDTLTTIQIDQSLNINETRNSIQFETHDNWSKTNELCYVQSLASLLKLVEKRTG